MQTDPLGQELPQAAGGRGGRMVVGTSSHWSSSCLGLVKATPSAVCH